MFKLRIVFGGEVKFVEISQQSVSAGISLEQILPDIVSQLGLQDKTVSFEGYSFQDLSGKQISENTTIQNLSVIEIVPNALASKTVSAKNKRYDDVVELVGDLANNTIQPWTAKSTERSTLIMGSLLLLVAAAMFSLSYPNVEIGACSAALAILLPILSIIGEKQKQFKLVPLVWILTSGIFWVIAGHHLMSSLDGGEYSDFGMLFGILTVVPLILVRGKKEYIATPILFTVIWLIISLTDLFTDSRKIVISFLVVILLIFVVFLDRIVLSTSKIKMQMPVDDQRLFDDPEPIDNNFVAKQFYSRSHLLSALSLGICLCLLTFIPQLTSSKEPFGLALILCAFTLIAVLSRRFISHRDCSILVFSAIASVLLAVYFANSFHPDWQIWLAVAVVISSFVSLFFILFGYNQKYSPFRSQLLGILELILGVAIIPLGVLASGLLGSLM
ncbi:MAG: hypothetical protein LBM13_06190 [Candidatus Ancillula sp.]|jgi:hypothetical protein|nr:hypothetical protein [Candidatus Ancillula sp.]